MNHHFTLIDDLERAISFRSPERRVETLNRITDLFVAGSVVYSDAQIALFDDVITRLVATVEAEARAALANRLAAHPDAPPKLMRSLASDDAAAVAGPV